jgi:cytochrome c
MNKIIVSIVLAIILILGINKIADIIYYVEKPEKSTYKVVDVSTTVSSETTEVTSTDSEITDIMVLLAAASVTDGEKIFKKCAACHSISKGGGNKIGPALWNVLGRQTGSLPDYKYSKAMAAHGKSWSFEEMNGFLTKPKNWIKGTKMSFIGLKSGKERAAVILYMNNNSDSPLSLQ